LAYFPVAISRIERFPGTSSIYARVGQPLGAGWPAGGIKTVGRETAKIARARARDCESPRRGTEIFEIRRGSFAAPSSINYFKGNATPTLDIVCSSEGKEKKKKMILYRR